MRVTSFPMPLPLWLGSVRNNKPRKKQLQENGVGTERFLRQTRCAPPAIMTSNSAKDGSVGSVRKMLTSPTMHCSSSTLVFAHRCLSKMMNVHSGKTEFEIFYMCMTPGWCNILLSYQIQWLPDICKCYEKTHLMMVWISEWKNSNWGCAGENFMLTITGWSVAIKTALLNIFCYFLCSHCRQMTPYCHYLPSSSAACCTPVPGSVAPKRSAAAAQETSSTHDTWNRWTKDMERTEGGSRFTASDLSVKEKHKGK